jgi:hypothetical protein
VSDTTDDAISTTAGLIKIPNASFVGMTRPGWEGSLAVYNCCKIPSGKSLILPYICAICFTHPPGGLKKNNA